MGPLHHQTPRVDAPRVQDRARQAQQASPPSDSSGVINEHMRRVCFLFRTVICSLFLFGIFTETVKIGRSVRLLDFGISLPMHVCDAALLTSCLCASCHGHVPSHSSIRRVGLCFFNHNYLYQCHPDCLGVFPSTTIAYYGRACKNMPLFFCE